MRIKLHETQSSSILTNSKLSREEPPSTPPEDNAPTQTKTKRKQQQTLPGLSPTVPPGQIKGRRNELNILVQLHMFGWLTARQIAALCWPSAKAPLQMARNVLQRLKAKSLVLQKPLFDDNFAYVLLAAGVDLLREEGISSAKTGKDLLRGKRYSNALHRWVANQFLILRLRKGTLIWSEYEILSFRGPFPNGERIWREKTPDAIVGQKRVDGILALEWCEVELSNRNSSDLRKLTTLIVEGLDQPTLLASRIELVSVNLIYPLDSMNTATCQHAYKRASRLINAIIKALPSVLAHRRPSDAYRKKKHILQNTHITIMDVGNGPVCRELKDKTVNLWTLLEKDDEYHKRLIGFFIS